MSDTAFVDTNLLIYARDPADPAKQARAEQWVRALWESRRARLSVQVLQEYYAVATRKLKPGLALDDARADVRALWSWKPILVDAALCERAWELEDRFSISWWDALVVAAAQTARCRWLLTEDLQDGQSFGAVSVVDPFAHVPALLGMDPR